MARESKRKRDERRFGRAERLADVIATRGLDVPSYLDSDPALRRACLAANDRVTRHVARGPVVLAQNVREYVDDRYTGSLVEYASDIPNFSPPFSPMFVEFADLSDIHHGMLIQTFPGPASPRDGSWPIDFATFVPGEAPLVVFAEHVLRVDDVVVGPLAVFFAGIDEKGAVVGDISANVTFAKYMPDSTFDTCIAQGKSAFFTAFMAISFMHCGNVAVSPVDPPPGLNRERKKACLKPFVRYHTINIEPMKKVLRVEGNVEANGLRKALHIVRGHFTHYSEEKPLFGRPGLHGTFWTPSHARGSIDRGFVVSDYNVNAPKREGATPCP